MIDTSFRFDYAWKEIIDALTWLKVDYKKLDVFITHNHPDHVGYAHDLHELGATVYMNPEEATVKTDLFRCYLSHDQADYINLRAIGVTKERYPKDYDQIVTNMSRRLVDRKEPRTIPYTPVYPGDRLEYDEYNFEVISLKGHSIGQLGLFEKKHNLLFSGDQLMRAIVPIVTSPKKDLDLLSYYIDSLNEIKEKYHDSTILPCHYDTINNPGEEVERILLSYKERCEKILNVLKESGEWMVTRDIGVGSYNRGYMATDYSRITLCTQIWAKTFSCLEYMYMQGYLNRKEENGIIYWRIR